MKILRFNPPGQAASQSGPQSPKPPSGGDFAGVLKAAAQAAPSKELPNPLHQNYPARGEIISLENRRASLLPSPADLGVAGRLISRLDQEIRASSPELLQKVHNLEGLVYIYTP